MTFVVVDLETTGGSPADCGITEIGAVKVRGGQVLGEFHTLVNPGAPIPAFIAVLTGITDAMVAAAPRIEAVLPAFLEFAAGCVLVAHNAGFDVGFLKAACARAEHAWPGFAVVDTVRLARHVLTRDEARDRRLATLARLFRSATTPDHRALHDARATVDVLHGLIERVGNLGVHIASRSSRRTPRGCRRPHGASAISPRACRTRPASTSSATTPGEPLYVGTSVDIRTRVRIYFTAAEQRTRMAEMVAVAERVDAGRVRHAARGPRCGSCDSSPSTRRGTTGGPASRSAHRGSSSPSSRSPGCPSSAEVRDDGVGVRRAVRLHAAGRARGRGAPRGVPAAPVHPAAAATGRRVRVGMPARRHRPVRRALRRAAGRRGVRRRRRRRPIGDDGRRPRCRPRPARPGRRAVGAAAVRGGRRRPGPSALLRPRGRPRAAAHAARRHRASSSPRCGRRGAGGSSLSSATAGSPGRRRARPAPTRARTSRR